MRRVPRRGSISGRRAHAREDGGQRRVEAVRDDLEELLARPRGLGVRVEVVEHEQRRGAHLVEQVVEVDLGIVAIGRAQVVEQIRDGEEERGVAALDAAVRDRGGEVRLAGAVRAREHQPALGRVGEPLGGVDGGTVPALRGGLGGAAGAHERRECQALERAESRVREQPAAARVDVLALRALAGDGAAERRVLGVVGDAHEARAVAERADAGAAVRGPLTRGRSCVGRRVRRDRGAVRVPARSQQVHQRLHRLAPPLPSVRGSPPRIARSARCARRPRGWRPRSRSRGSAPPPHGGPS